MALTRKDIRRSIGYDIQGVLDGGMVVGDATSFTATTLVDPARNEVENEGVGRWLVIDGHIAVVTAFDPDAHEITFAPEHPDPPSEAGDYELWDEKYHPARVNSLINQAIVDAQANGVYVPTLIDTAYCPPSSRRIKAPADWDVMRMIEMSHWTGWNYFDLRPTFEADDNVEGDSQFYPFYTYKLTSARTLTVTPSVNLGLFDAIGWEVAGSFDGKTGDDRAWEFVKEAFNPYTATYDSDGNLQISYDAGPASYVLHAYLYRESDVTWFPVEFTIWQGSGEIELPPGYSSYTTYEGARLRLHGGSTLPMIDDDADEPAVPASFIRTQALVNLLRSIPQVVVGEDPTPIRREWELRAQREYGQLQRMMPIWEL